MVVASATDEEGEELFPRKWNKKIIRMPKVNKKKQRTPSFTGEVVTEVLRETDEEKYCVLFALLASSGLRFGEALGLDIKNISPDCSNIKIVEKAWGSERYDFLKTESGEREVDLHPSIAAVLRNFTATPQGLLQFWMGHAGEGMSDLYDKIKADVKFRKEMAEKAGLGFELPKDFSSKIRVLGRKWTETPSAQASACA